MIDKTRYSILNKIGKGYSTGEFADVFEYFDDEIVWESQWSLEPRVGKQTVIDYYKTKGQMIKQSDSKVKYEIVEFTGPKPGELGLNINQKFDDQSNDMQIDITWTKDNKIKRIDICIQTLFRYKHIPKK